MTTLLVDGDVIAYNACQDRYRRSGNVKSELVISSNLLADVLDRYEYLSYYRNEADFTDAENEKYLYKAFDDFRDIIADLAETCFATKIKVAVAGKDNFRDIIFPAYKANRHSDESKKNPFVPIIRKMAAESGMAVEAHGMEADDLLRMWAEECRLAGEEFVVASVDKDLKMIPGSHYLIHKQVFFYSDDDFALRFYYEQLLQGDPTDNIQGVPGVGPIKAKSLLEDCFTEQEFQERVLQIYYSTIHQWRYALQLTGQLIYLKKHKDDWFDMSRWPVIELEDIVNKPKKQKMENWTVELALAAVDPFSVTTRARWENALMFLIESKPDLPQNILDAIDVIAERDKVPQPEKDAYAALKRFFGDTTAPSIAAPPPLPKAVTPLPTLPTIKLPELPKIPEKVAVKLPNLPPMVAAARKPEVPPPVVLSSTSTEIHQPIVAKPKIAIPAVPVKAPVETKVVPPTAPAAVPKFDFSFLKK